MFLTKYNTTGWKVLLGLNSFLHIILATVALPSLERRTLSNLRTREDLPDLPESAFEHFTWGKSCTDEQKKIIKRSYAVIDHVLDEQSDALVKNVRHLNTMMQGMSLYGSEQTELKLFQRYFGDFRKDECDASGQGLSMSDALSRVQAVQGTNKKVKDKAFTGHKMSIYCDDKNLKLHKESGEVKVFENVEDPQKRTKSIHTDSTLCTDDSNTLATLIHPDDDSNGKSDDTDWLIICPRAWKDWGSDHLWNYRSKVYGQMAGKKLDTLAKTTPDILLLHELTHSNQLFGKDTLKDERFDYGDYEAYEFEGVSELATLWSDTVNPNDDNPDADVSLGANDPVKNAETFAYYAAVTYLKQCDWFDGVCKPVKFH